MVKAFNRTDSFKYFKILSIRIYAIIRAWKRKTVRVLVCIPVWKMIAGIGARSYLSASTRNGTLRTRWSSRRRDEARALLSMRGGPGEGMPCSCVCVLDTIQKAFGLLKLARLLPKRATYKAAQRDLYDYDSEKGLEAMNGVHNVNSTRPW